MTLIDTSSLVHFMRLKGDRGVKERVTATLIRGEAAICELVAVELWMGIGSSQDARDVEDLCSLVCMLPITQGVWARAKQLAERCRNNGTPVPSSDVIISACAFEHGASIDFEDQHFSILENLR